MYTLTYWEANTTLAMLALIAAGQIESPPLVTFVFYAVFNFKHLTVGQEVSSLIYRWKWYKHN